MTRMEERVVAGDEGDRESKGLRDSSRVMCSSDVPSREGMRTKR